MKGGVTGGCGEEGGRGEGVVEGSVWRGEGGGGVVGREWCRGEGVVKGEGRNGKYWENQQHEGKRGCSCPRGCRRQEVSTPTLFLVLHDIFS